MLFEPFAEPIQIGQSWDKKMLFFDFSFFMGPIFYELNNVLLSFSQLDKRCFRHFYLFSDEDIKLTDFAVLASQASPIQF